MRINTEKRPFSRRQMNHAKIQAMILKNSAAIREFFTLGDYPGVIHICQRTLTIRPEHPTFTRFVKLATYKMQLHNGQFELAEKSYQSYQYLALSRLEGAMPSTSFAFKELIELSACKIESIQSIENRLDVVAKREQNLLFVMTNLPTNEKKAFNNFYKSLNECFQKIQQVQKNISTKLTRFITHITTQPKNLTADISRRKALWIQIDEALFLLNKFKMIGVYMSILQRHIHKYEHTPNYQNHKSIQHLSNLCEQSKQQLLAETYPKAVEQLQKLIKTFTAGHSTRADRHLWKRLNHLSIRLPYSNPTSPTRLSAKAVPSTSNLSTDMAYSTGDYPNATTNR